MRLKHLSALLCLVFLTGCFPPFGILTPGPGKGPYAHLQYARAKPVIAALEKYHADKDTYPESLKALVPDYLSDVPSSLGYSGKKDSYGFSFSYTNGFMNHCFYTSQKKEWSCFGYM